MTKVSHQSSNVDWTDYDPDTQRLTVRFHSGKSYTYSGVRPAAYENLINADSVGRHLNVHIIPHHPAKAH